MNQLAKDISAEVVELIHRYGFDLGGYSCHALVDYWMQQYPAPWVRLATIEALYQGRYKAISIEQILNLWRRRTRALYHFNSEFERMISLRPMLAAATPVALTAPTPTASQTTASQNGRGESVQPGATPLENDAANEFSDWEQLAETDAKASFADRQVSQAGRSRSSSFEVVNAGKDAREISSAVMSEPPPIDQFTPTLEVSDFYWRLKAVVQAMGTGTAEEIGRRN